MTPKEYLSQAYKIERRINIINAKVSKLRSRLEYKGISYEGCGSSCSASNDKMPDMIAKISEYEYRQKELAENLLAKRFEIESVMDSVRIMREMEKFIRPCAEFEQKSREELIAFIKHMFDVLSGLGDYEDMEVEDNDG